MISNYSRIDEKQEKNKISIWEKILSFDSVNIKEVYNFEGISWKCTHLYHGNNYKRYNFKCQNANIFKCFKRLKAHCIMTENENQSKIILYKIGRHTEECLNNNGTQKMTKTRLISMVTEYTERKTYFIKIEWHKKGIYMTERKISQIFWKNKMKNRINDINSFNFKNEIDRL